MESLWKIEKLRSETKKQHTLMSGFACAKVNFVFLFWGVGGWRGEEKDDKIKLFPYFFSIEIVFLTFSLGVFNLLISFYDKNFFQLSSLPFPFFSFLCCYQGFLLENKPESAAAVIEVLNQVTHKFICHYINP